MQNPINNHQQSIINPYDYRLRMEPRFKAWQNKGQPKVKKNSIINTISSLNLNPFAFSKVSNNKKSISTKNPIKEIKNLPLKMNSLPSDIVKIIINFLDLKTQRTWRLVDTTWKQWIDEDPSLMYWRNSELEMMNRELPKFLIDAFEGALHIQKLPIIRLSARQNEHFEIRSRFIYSKFSLQYRIDWITIQELPGVISRGIAPDGSYYLCFQLTNHTIKKNVVMTLQESSPRFETCKDQPIGWVANNSANHLVDSFFDGTLCIIGSKEKNEMGDEMRKKFNKLVKGEKVESLVDLPYTNHKTKIVHSLKT